MNFALTEEQSLLRDAVLRFLQRDYDFARRRAILDSPQGWSRSAWSQMAGLGLPGLLVPEAQGGYGGTMADLAVVMEAAGEGLLLEPLLATAVLGVSGLVALGSDAQQAALLPKILAGELILSLAYAEPPEAQAADGVPVRAEPEGRGYCLRGRKTAVLHGAQADWLLVSARETSGGLGLYLVERSAAGLHCTDRRSIDGLRAAEVSLEGVRLAPEARLGGPGADASGTIDQVLDRATVALCAEAVGAMQQLVTQTIDYIKTRHQFGQPIGRQQVLRHAAADMHIRLEQSRSMLCFAAAACDSAPAVDRQRAVSAAKVFMGRAGRALAQAAIQMHGGMGMTDELPASHYARRLTMVDFWFGTRDWHRQRFIAAQAPLPG
jgi:alkylation response protein AidB-like acyl-CoA dehydrogenase